MNQGLFSPLIESKRTTLPLNLACLLLNATLVLESAKKSAITIVDIWKLRMNMIEANSNNESPKWNGRLRCVGVAFW